MVTCTGCALLCDDIEVIVENNRIKETQNACRHGAAKIRGCIKRLAPSIAQRPADIESCIKKAVEILKDAKSPMLFGWSNSTCEAQSKGIQLAKKLNAVIDDTSSFCQGILIEKVLQKKFRTCTLPDIRNKADVLVYWGSDAQDSEPRHLSRFSYFPRGEARQRGYEEDRIAIAIDVRESNTAKICKGHFYRIPLKGDREFILALMDALSGKVPKLDAKKMLELASILKKAEFGAIFVGIGLTYSIKDDFDILVKLADMLPNFNIMPMVGHYNMRGFNEVLFKETGFVNRVKFDGKAAHDNKYSIVEALRNKCIDALLVIGSDPLSSLPRSVISHLANIPLICIDPCVTLTSRIASVTIPCAVSGVESGGSAVRMDGEVVELTKILKTDYPSDEELLTRLMEAL
ncbi:MAG: formylmethanofuran dehydrogenase subunit B [Candidatus Methanoperedens sp.]|nr:formylmethanofuran dehydrogenase subunit B [Candidatus Methanoperedens sp.]MCZ7395837.1 formylmethanofuran dehydrogenase subunit B [Candidatus Methanoperedens sp.]